VAGCARAGKPVPARVLLAVLAICFSCGISSTLSAADRPASAPLQKGSLVQLNLAFFDPPDPPGGTLSESLWEQLDEPARCAALEILARLIARMLVAAAKEASHD
jgi:hypothetical protein